MTTNIALSFPSERGERQRQRGAKEQAGGYFSTITLLK